ncbi:unnamed protein product, partial [Musa acuminata subsp. malaccensis]
YKAFSSRQVNSLKLILPSPSTSKARIILSQSSSLRPSCNPNLLITHHSSPGLMNPSSFLSKTQNASFSSSKLAFFSSSSASTSSTNLHSPPPPSTSTASSLGPNRPSLPMITSISWWESSSVPVHRRCCCCSSSISVSVRTIKHLIFVWHLIFVRADLTKFEMRSESITSSINK